jgi:hypothetical protein
MTWQTLSAKETRVLVVEEDVAGIMCQALSLYAGF